MYVPSHFCETDQEKLFDFIEAHSFGLLVSQLEGEAFATHLPLLLERDSGSSAALVGHMARANPHWQTSDSKALAIFSGPHAYISPTWYEAEHVVPTWNYVAVHAYGRLHIIESHADTLQVLRDYVAKYEGPRPSPWPMDESDGFIDKLARTVVAFRIEIERLEGKWKLNQNRPREQREKVIRALDAQANEDSLAVSKLMRESLTE
jgi:transcriptional regulator